MEKEIKVSIYCLAYNHEKYIRNALDGFVGQKTSFPFEVIIHDDASTDSTASIIREYETKYPDIIKPIYQTENQYSQKIPIFSTHVLPKVQGKYIACCEGDDYWTDCDKLQKQVDFLDSHEDYSACVHETSQLNMLTGEETLINGSQTDKDITFEEAIKGGNMSFQMSSMIYRKELAYDRPDFFTKAKGFGDYPLSIWLTLSGKVRFFARNMSTYRYLRDGSWTLKNRQDDGQKKIAHFASVIDMLRSVDDYTDGIYRKLIKKVILKNEFEIDRVKAGRIPLKLRYVPIYVQKVIRRLGRK